MPNCTYYLYSLSLNGNQSKIRLLRKEKKSDKGKIPIIWDNGLFPNNNLTYGPTFQLLFGCSTQVKEIKLLSTILPITQHTFLGACSRYSRNSSRLGDMAINMTEFSPSRSYPSVGNETVNQQIAKKRVMQFFKVNNLTLPLMLPPFPQMTQIQNIGQLSYF